jgi:histidyl-tRNA synthetase
MKPSIPKGTRDMNPAEMQKRNYIFDTIKKQFHLFGFEQIETPAMENLTTLTGKYGEEGDQLLFKILNSRIHESKNKEILQQEFSLSLDQARNTELLTERALRYDLTVPFARYVVMHQHEITFPFRRFQIQPVWRADKPQKGRYREFYQCDADMIGSNSLLNELELIKLMDEVFSALNLPVCIKINNRKILSGIAEITGNADKITDITIAIDKLDKIGKQEVINELVSKGISEEAIKKLDPIFNSSGTNAEKIQLLNTILKDSEIGKKGIEEIQFLIEQIDALSLKTAKLELDITLARGLNYYTGAIFEVKSLTGTLSSSITGGGRYDDLTGIFGLKNMSGVGISFGIDRILDVMNEMNLFPKSIDNRSSSDILFVNFGEAEQKLLLPILYQIRTSGIKAELYPDHAKIKKQFDYADKKKIPYVAIVGSEEINSGIIKIKNMITGEQSNCSKEQLQNLLSKNN